MEVKLRKEFFGVKERLFLTSGGIRAVLFTYDTGVHAVKLKTRRGTPSCSPSRASRCGTRSSMEEA